MFSIRTKSENENGDGNIKQDVRDIMCMQTA